MLTFPGNDPVLAWATVFYGTLLRYLEQYLVPVLTGVYPYPCLRLYVKYVSGHCAPTVSRTPVSLIPHMAYGEELLRHLAIGAIMGADKNKGPVFVYDSAL